MTNEKRRWTGIDLLKVFLMLGVVLLHYNNNGIGKAFLYAKPFENRYLFLMLAESICINVVNVFMLITGFFQCKSEKGGGGQQGCIFVNPGGGIQRNHTYSGFICDACDEHVIEECHISTTP